MKEQNQFSPEDFDALQRANEALRKELEDSEKKGREQAAAHAEILKGIRLAVQHGGAIVVRPREPVEGEFAVDFKHPKTGKQVKKTFRFQDGHQRVRLGNGEVVGSAALVRIANEGQASDEELSAFPALVGLSQSAASDRLTDLVKLSYPYLVEA